MRQLVPLIFLAIVVGSLAGCVPTTKYNYVPLTQTNFEAAQAGEKIPLVAAMTAVCFADGHTALIRDAVWMDDGICGEARPPVTGDDGHECYGADQLAGIGIPYEGRSASVVPMAAVHVGTCDPAALGD